VSSRTLLEVAVAAVLGAGVVLALLAVGTKVVQRWRITRRTRREDALRPSVAALAAGDPDPSGLRGLRRGDFRVARDLVVGSLGKVRGEGHDALVAYLVRAGVADRARRRLRRPGATGRARALDSLGRLGDPADADLATRCLRSRDPVLRIVAARALARTGGPDAVPVLAQSLVATREVPAGIVATAVLDVGPAAGEPLTVLLDDPHAEVRELGAELLGVERTVAAAPALVERLRQDASGAVRIAAARALGRIGAPTAVVPLVAALDRDEPDELRATAAEALGVLGARDAVPALTAQVADPSHRPAHEAAVALADLGTAGARALTELTRGDDTAAAHAREALARLPGPQRIDWRAPR
jgi:HEAT repeat protein